MINIVNASLDLVFIEIITDVTSAKFKYKES